MKTENLMLITDARAVLPEFGRTQMVWFRVEAGDEACLIF
jgi:hypothetical protein